MGGTAITKLISKSTPGVEGLENLVDLFLSDVK